MSATTAVTSSSFISISRPMKFIFFLKLMIWAFRKIYVSYGLNTFLTSIQRKTHFLHFYNSPKTADIFSISQYFDFCENQILVKICQNIFGCIFFPICVCYGLVTLLRGCIILLADEACFQKYITIYISFR